MATSRRSLKLVLIINLLLTVSLAENEKEAKINSRSKRQLPGMKMFQRFFGKNRESGHNIHNEEHYPQIHLAGPEIVHQLEISYRDHGGHKGHQIHDPHKGHGHEIHEIHDPHKGYGHEIHDPHKGYGHEIHDPHKGYGHEIHDPHKGYGHEIHEIHDPHKGYGHEIHDPHKGYGHEIHDPHKGKLHEIHEIHDLHGNGYGHDVHEVHGGGGYGHDSYHSGPSHAYETSHPTYNEKPKKFKPAYYKGPKYGPYDLVAPDKSKKGKGTKYGDDPVNETKKGGYHKEKVTEHFGGFGGGGSVGIKAKKGGHKGGGGYSSGGGHKGGGGYSSGGGHKGGGGKGGHKGGGYSHHRAEFVELHHEAPIYKYNEPPIYEHLEKPKNTYDPHANRQIDYSDISSHVDITQMLLSDPYSQGKSDLPKGKEAKERGGKHLVAESRL